VSYMNELREIVSKITALREKLEEDLKKDKAVIESLKVTEKDLK